jgi:hypothetical protein
MRRSLYCSWKRHVLVLLLFGAAFGYLEAAVVSYLRYLHEPFVHRFYPGRPSGNLFPLLTGQQAATAGQQERRVRITELGREAATLIMLGGVALAISTNSGQWVAAFIIAFGLGHHVLRLSEGDTGLAGLTSYLGHPVHHSCSMGGASACAGFSFSNDDCGGRLAPAARGNTEPRATRPLELGRACCWSRRHHTLVHPRLCQRDGRCSSKTVPLVGVCDWHGDCRSGLYQGSGGKQDTSGGCIGLSLAGLHNPDEIDGASWPASIATSMLCRFSNAGPSPRAHSAHHLRLPLHV